MIINLLLWSIFSWSGLLHDYHVSVTEIDYKSSSRTVQITHKIFTDDLEKAIEEKFKSRAYLGLPKQSQQAEQWISAYVQSNFSLSINDKKAALRYIGFELEQDKVFVYAEVTNISAVKEVTVSNTILLEIFRDQANLVHFNINGVKKSLYLNSRETSDIAAFP